MPINANTERNNDGMDSSVYANTDSTVTYSIKAVQINARDSTKLIVQG